MSDTKPLTRRGNLVTIDVVSLSQESREILQRVKAGQFSLLQHASDRSKQRGVFIEQIIHCAETCFHWRWQPNHKTHLFLGYLAEGRSGGFTAVLLDKVLVVTVFKRRLTKWEKNLSKSKKL